MQNITKTGGVRCVFCGGTIPWTVMDYKKPFRCTHCHELVRVSRDYMWWLTVIHLLIAGIICFAVGLRGIALLPATVIAGLILLFLTGVPLRHLSPPPLEPERDARALLHDDDQSEDSRGQ